MKVNHKEARATLQVRKAVENDAERRRELKVDLRVLGVRAHERVDIAWPTGEEGRGEGAGRKVCGESAGARMIRKSESCEETKM